MSSGIAEHSSFQAKSFCPYHTYMQTVLAENIGKFTPDKFVFIEEWIET